MNETSLYESLYGHPASKPEPAEHALFQKVEAEFYGDIESLGAGVVRQFTMLLNKPDLKEYQQYAFYLFNERAVDWPNIDPKTKAALILGRGVMQEGLWTPNYETGLEVPDDPDIDRAIDKAILALASWCSDILTLQVAQKWAKICIKYGPVFERIQPEVPKGQGDSSLNAAIRIIARRHPMVLNRASFLTGIFNLMGF